jgi:hypothetical protein
MGGKPSSGSPQAFSILPNTSGVAGTDIVSDVGFTVAPRRTSLLPVMFMHFTV